ncbi:hypothetical protein SSTU70S_01055 [Stutzerimonas stutzeri]
MIEVFECQPFNQRAFGHPPDHQVQLADPQQPEQMSAGPADYADLQRFMLRMQSMHHLWQKRAFHRTERTETHTGSFMGTVAQAAHALAQRLHADPGIAQEGLPRARQHNPALAALAQRGAQILFQLTQRLGHGRRADGQHRRRAGQTPLASNLQKAGQVAKLDAIIECHGGRESWVI